MNPYSICLIELVVIIAAMVVFIIVGNRMLGPQEPLE